MPFSAHHQGYLLTDDPARLDAAAIHAYLTRSYWAAGIPRDLVERSLQNSLCLGVYSPEGAQVGLVRVITDCATFAYLCDVYVLEEHRGHGLAKAALHALEAHPRLQAIRRWHLVTQDAQGLYAQRGFKVVAQPDKHMERVEPGIYQRLAR
jgi:N-acetylglutamate synthase-like GNAT family acetyltransferase